MITMLAAAAIAIVINTGGVKPKIVPDPDVDGIGVELDDEMNGDFVIDQRFVPANIMTIEKFSEAAYMKSLLATRTPVALSK